MKEMHQNTTDKVRVYWIVHGTHLLRVAPEHIRPDVSEQGCVLMDNLEHAKLTLGSRKASGVTQYHDLSN